MTAFILGIVISLLLIWAMRHFTGFTSQKPDEYVGNLPTFDMHRHLSGELLCEGMIFGPTGRVTSRFRATMKMQWEGPRGTMDEHFIYDDGSTQDREWRLTLEDNGAIRAEADDVIGTGRGSLAGNTLGLRYRIRLPESNGGHVLDAVDWMYVQPDGVILNRSQFRKFGIKVAELFCTIRPMGAQHA